MKKISIVIPLCNEEESLSPLMNQIHEVMGSLECEYEVLFVDDGSTDGSFGVLQQLRNQFGNIIPIYRPQ